MKIHQVTEKKKIIEERMEALVQKILEISEAGQFTRIDIEHHLAEYQSDAPERKDQRNIICDPLCDPKALQIIATKLFHEIRILSLSKIIEKSKRRVMHNINELRLHICDQYDLEDDTPFYYDNGQLCILEGISPSERQSYQETLGVAKKLINSSEAQLSVLCEHAEELSNFEKDLIELLMGPEREEVVVTCEKMFRMSNDELEVFIKREERSPLQYITRMLKDVKN